MPIAEGTVVKKAKQTTTKSAPAKKRPVQKPQTEIEDDPQSLFDFKESKYHDDLLNRDSQKT